MGEEQDSVHRYTDLPALLYLLQRRQLTLLDPMTWDDSNDSHFLTKYKEARRLTCLSALCFSLADETYHHWRVFAGGSSGVRITFLRNLLLHEIKKVPEIRHGEVKYKLLKDVREGVPSVEQLPFLKRYPYEQEQEYRFIYESTERSQGPIDIDFPTRAIRRITLSPWINQKVSDAVKEVIRSVAGFQKLAVSRSTLIGNDDWKAYGDRARREP